MMMMIYRRQLKLATELIGTLSNDKATTKNFSQ